MSNDESDPPELRILDPPVLKFIQGNGAIAPGGVGEQHSVCPDATENDEMVIAGEADWYDNGSVVDKIFQDHVSISNPLVATAVGLAAAIPAVVAYNHYLNRIRRIEDELEHFAEELTLLFDSRLPHEQRLGHRPSPPH